MPIAPIQSIPLKELIEIPVKQVNARAAKFEIPIEANPLKPERMAKMAEGMAKSANVDVVISESNSSPMAPTGSIGLGWNGIPLDMARFFNVEITKADKAVISKLQDIHNWTKDGGIDDSIGNRLLKLQKLETKLGAPNFYESRIDRTWKYIKMDFSIRELQKRQQAGG